MELRSDSLLYIAIAFAIIGIILLMGGSYLPVPAIIPLSIAILCFVIVLVTAILALWTYQREYAKSRGRELF
jgi:membrane protein implicated in regulation of membrane protease activity